MTLLPSLSLKSLFPLVPFFVLACKGIEFDILWLSAKYSGVLSIFHSCPGNALTSLPVVLLESLNCRTIFYQLICRWQLSYWYKLWFFFKKVVVLATWGFELRLVVAFVPFLELESLLLRLKLIFRPRDEAYFTVRLSKRACGHAVAERLIHLFIYSKLSLPSIYT